MAGWILLLLSSFIALAESAVFMCYVNHGSVYRPDEGKFRIQDIDPFLCTHIIYSYSAITDVYEVESSDKWADSKPGMNNIGKLVNLKKKSPNLKVITGLGGWNAGSKVFSDIAKSSELRQNFIKSAMTFMSINKFDGMELDWQMPGQRDGDPEEDKDNFPILLEEMSAEFKKNNKILIARLLGRQFAAEIGYDLPRISDAVDFITMKSYEYHGAWEGTAGVYAPLVSQDGENVEQSISYFLSEGVNASKLLLGISAGGNAYVLEVASSGSNFGSKVVGGFKGAWIAQEGFMGFNEICWGLTKSRLWKQGWDKITSTPWAIHGRQFVSYEDVESIEAKLDFVKSKHLGGVAFHSLDFDDFGGHCYQQPYPLASAVHRVLQKNQMDVSTVKSIGAGKIVIEES